MLALQISSAPLLRRATVLTIMLSVLVLCCPPLSRAGAEVADTKAVVDTGAKTSNSAATTADAVPIASTSPEAASQPPGETKTDATESKDGQSCGHLEAKRLEAVTKAGRQVSAADFERFITEQVRLYYLTDIPRLMRQLNPQSFEVNSAKELDTKLIEWYSSGEQKQQAVNDAIKAVNKAKEDFITANTAVASEQPTLDAANNACDQAEQDETEAKSAYDALSDEDPQKESAEKALTAAKKKNEDAKAAAAKAQQDLTSKQGAQKAAEEILKSKGDLLEAASSELKLVMYSEVRAFAERRDQPPFWVGPIDICSNDPIKRTLIYGFPDSHTLLLRGCRDDVKEALEVIAYRDQPAPQTKLTLWSLELNVEQPLGLGKLSKSAEKVNVALDDMENEFRDCREQMAAALSILRDVLVETVNKETDKDQYITDRFNKNSIKIELYGYPDHYPQRGFFFYNTNVLYKLGFIDSRHINNSTDVHPLASDGWWDKFYYTRYSIPDPVNITTLSEALLVLTLARDEYRKEVMQEYERRLNNYLVSRKLETPCTEYQFSRLKRALNVDAPPQASTLLAGTQLTIINGLQREMVDRLFPVSRALAKDFNSTLNTVDSSNRDTKEPIDALPWPKDPKYMLLQGVLKNTTNKPDNVIINNDDDSIKQIMESMLEIDQASIGLDLSAIYDSSPDSKAILRAILICNNFGNILSWIYNEFGISPSTLIHKQTLMHNSMESFFAPGETDPDIAKADQYLKELNIAMEDDLDEMFVQPMLQRLRAKLIKDRLNVGVIQRTSLLATNRLPARIEPHMSAELQLGEEQDVLSAAQQVSKFLPQLEGQNLFKSAERNTVLDAVAGLQQSSEDQNTQIYAITSGSRFVVTPVFDPTGQAQRFRFDYVYSNMIRDPDNSTGGVNPRLPRTESLSVNTEAQISNFEIRMLAAAETNARLGLTERRTGGIPILKDISCLRDVPLIGWFKRRGGSDAVVQHTIIFAQSTMYPTIGDIVHVLTQPLPDVAHICDERSHLQTQGVVKPSGDEQSCEVVAPAEKPYVWKGLVAWQQLISQAERDALAEGGLSKAAQDALEKRTVCVNKKHLHPAAGLQVVIFEENAPNNPMRTASTVTKEDGSFEIEFSWNERYRYRLAVFDEQADKLLFNTQFKFIPKQDFKKGEGGPGTPPIFDSSKAGPIIVKLNHKCVKGQVKLEK